MKILRVSCSSRETSVRFVLVLRTRHVTLTMLLITQFEESINGNTVKTLGSFPFVLPVSLFCVPRGGWESALKMQRHPSARGNLCNHPQGSQDTQRPPPRGFGGNPAFQGNFTTSDLTWTNTLAERRSRPSSRGPALAHQPSLLQGHRCL